MLEEILELQQAPPKKAVRRKTALKFASQIASLILESLPFFLLQLQHVPGTILQSGS